MPRKSDRRAELAQIHLAAKALGMDTSDRDPTSSYRASLWAVARVHSAADLDHTQRQAVLDHFKRLGWKNERRTAPRKQVAEGKQQMMDKIGALLTESGLTWQYASGIAKQMFNVEHIDWLTGQQTYKVLQALLVAQRRKGRNAASAA